MKFSHENIHKEIKDDKISDLLKFEKKSVIENENIFSKLNFSKNSFIKIIKKTKDRIQHLQKLKNL